MARTFYDVMMISPRADRQLITVVYRHLAKRYHPDKDPSPQAAARMAELNEAYATLSDRGKRAIYDVKIGLEPPGRPAPARSRVETAGYQPGDSRPTRAGGANTDPLARAPFGEAGPPPANPEASGRPLSFGRYRGWTLNQVGRYDRDYLEWLSRTTMGRNYKHELDDLLRHR